VGLVTANEHGELLAAVARRHVGVADRGAQGGADAAQKVVAGLVAVLVVELLEVVQVQHDERELAAVAVDLGDLVVQVVDERAVVVQAREPVAQRGGRQQPLHLVVLALDAPQKQPGGKEEHHAEEGLLDHRLRGVLAKAVVQDEEVAQPESDREAAELEEEHRGQEQREDEQGPQIRGAEHEDQGRHAEESGDQSSAAAEAEAAASELVRHVHHWGHAAPSRPCLGSPTTGIGDLLPCAAAAGVVRQDYKIRSSVTRCRAPRAPAHGLRSVG